MNSGWTCYEKNDYWASCRQSCEPGAIDPNDAPEYQTPWTCTVIGGSTPSPSPQPSPSPLPSPTPSPAPNPVPGMAFTTGTAGSGKARLFEFVDALTALPAAGSKYRAVRSSGGAAGGVVSESQGYGLLLAGAILASLQPEDADYQRVMDITHEMFLGWRRMCELTAARGSCQDDEGFQCGGGKYPCLSHWKFDDDLTNVIGSGSAPDGDADALAGMLFAVLAMEQESSPPAWLDEVGQWAYDTCKQFYMSSTVASSSGNHRIVKLGACWGGWDGDGQNPSYHAPGVYRLCRNYMKSHDTKYGSSADEGENWEAEWNKVIATTYKVLEATQCPSTGLVPNWAKVYEEGQSLRAETGFSGSGTPGAEYGSEASRTVWRVTLDYLLFPSEAGDAAAFLDPLATHLEGKETNGNWATTLDVDGSCLVDSIHSSWSWNMFMAGPTFSCLVCPANSVQEDRQQELIDAAGSRVASKAIEDYYSGSWIAISTITLNGDLLRAADRIGLLGSVSTTTTTTAAPTTQATTAVPTTTSASSGSEKVFAPVDAGSNRVCRGSSPSDNKPGYYFVVTVASLDGCKSECVASSGCVGLEYKGSRCEVWTRSEGIQASRESSGYTCLSYGIPVTLRPGNFEAVDGGEGRVCRGASVTDNQPSYFRVLQGTSLESCQRQCQISDDCVGVEHHEGGRCELWTRSLGIQASKSLQGYSCWRFVPEGAVGPTPREGEFEAVDGAVDRVCRGASPGDNAANYFDVVSGLPSLMSCQDLCRITSSCKGVEYHQTGRCELWKRSAGIGSSASLAGYSCWRFVEKLDS